MGAAKRVRLAFWLGEIDFEDVRVPQVEWAALKGQTPFGQLPVMSIDGGPYIAQSNAMQCNAPIYWNTCYKVMPCTSVFEGAGSYRAG